MSRLQRLKLKLLSQPGRVKEKRMFSQRTYWLMVAASIECIVFPCAAMLYICLAVVSVSAAYDVIWG
jgi:hypothetical protein